MTILRHELRRGRTALLVWTAAIAAFMAVCILIYPDMADEMGDMGELFANLGALSAAFGMDQLNYGTFTGYFSIECGNVLGLGGGLFAGLMGINALSGEEQGGTAEFLLTHPVSRARVVGEKLGALAFQLVILNAVTVAVSALCVWAIGEKAETDVLGLMFLAYFILQLEVAAITFGISAFLRRGGLGVGLGIAIGMYFLNLVGNITEKAEFLKYFTPYSYTDGAYIAEHTALPGEYLAVGLVFTAVGLIAAFWRYSKKDIA